jgi:hypothetical protein
MLLLAIMDDRDSEAKLLQMEFARLTVEYEKAIQTTWLASASFPLDLMAWKDALDKEEEVRIRRANVLQQLLSQGG